jgi:hypothetical protein
VQGSTIGDEPRSRWKNLAAALRVPPIGRKPHEMTQVTREPTASVDDDTMTNGVVAR